MQISASLPTTPLTFVPTQRTALPIDTFSIGPDGDVGLLRLLPGLGPRRDPDQAYAGLRSMAQGLRNGTLGVEDFHRRLADIDRELNAAIESKQAPETSRNLLAASAGLEFSVAGLMEDICRHGGLQETSELSLSLDQEHHFDMSYSGKAFTGSRSYETAGETRVLSLGVLQKPGGGPDDPATVRVRYSYPAHLPFNADGTPLEDKSSADILYFVPRRKDVAGLEAAIKQGDVIAPASTITPTITTVMNSLDQLSPVSLHNHTYGFGRVGTSYHQQIKAPVNFQVPDESMGKVAAVLTESALTDVMGVNLPGAPPQVETPTIGGRALRGAFGLGLVGALASGAGLFLGPLGLGVSALVVAGLGAATGMAFAGSVDKTMMLANGATEDQVHSERVKAFALGAAVGAGAGTAAVLVGSPLAATITTAGFAAAGAVAATA